MLQFKQIELNDKETADRILYPLSYRLCEYCFGDLYIWRKIYNTQIAFEDGLMFIRFSKDNEIYYLYPAGKGDIKGAVVALYENAQSAGMPFKIACVTPEMKAELESAFPSKFSFEPLRDTFDYIYNSEDLITLAGRKLHSKRNHYNRFISSGEWHYEAVTSDNIKDCIDMNDEWCRINGCGMDDGLKSEYCAVRQALKGFFELGMSGGMITLGGRVVAYSIGQKLCHDTFVVHIEKAFGDVEGAYTAINREFAAHNCAEFAYINREDDTGSEGLRKAKLSYHPAILLEKNTASLMSGAEL